MQYWQVPRASHANPTLDSVSIETYLHVTYHCKRNYCMLSQNVHCSELFLLKPEGGE